MKLWYRQPAESWNEALPLGNGKLGAMVFGGAQGEHIALNADSVWYGGPVDRNNPDALEFLPEIRRLIAAGQVPAAEQLAVKALTGVPENQRHYEPLADLRMEQDIEEPTEYWRELTLKGGIARVNFSAGGIAFQRECLISAPAQVMAFRITADSAGAISCRLRLRRQGGGRVDDQVKFEKYTHYYDRVERVGDTILFHGSGGRDGVRFVCGMTAIAEGGSCRFIGETLEINGADAATVYLAAETTFYHANPQAAVETRLSEVRDKGYEKIRVEHAADVGNLMKRVELDLGDGGKSDSADLPTDERLRKLAEGQDDLELEKLFFDFNRYLLIAASRPKSLPANLQGIWNSWWLPPWDGKYTININTEMNYWPAETCALSELHEPLFRHLERMAENGRKTAREMYGCRGWCAHHNTDIWGDTAPQGTHVPSSYWVMGGAWLCTHLWEHYLFTLDRDFLARVWPLLKGAAEFFIDFLIEDHQGRLVTSPSTSPENTYELADGTRGRLCQGPSMDSQILYELFTACMTAADILQTDLEVAAEFSRLRDRLPQPAVGSDGRLMEWSEEYFEPEPGHRHISHLWALYPGHQINPRHAPELAEACRRTLIGRLSQGGGHTGWSRAWIINFYARLLDGDEARSNLLAMLSQSTYPDLFDKHPPFQIDGNFGAAAAVAEMLVQSRVSSLAGNSNDVDCFDIRLLPARPAAWTEGRVNGLRTRGACTVELEWAENTLTAARVTAEKGGNFNLSFNKTVESVQLQPGETWHYK